MNGIFPIVALWIQLSTINRKIFCEFHGQKTRRRIGKTQRHKTLGSQYAIAWGPYPGQAIAVRPSDARGQKKPDVTSDARKHNEQGRFSQSSDEASNATLNASSFSFKRDDNKRVRQLLLLPLCFWLPGIAQSILLASSPRNSSKDCIRKRRRILLRISRFTRRCSRSVLNQGFRQHGLSFFCFISIGSVRNVRVE